MLVPERGDIPQSICDRTATNSQAAGDRGVEQDNCACTPYFIAAIVVSDNRFAELSEAEFPAPRYPCEWRGVRHGELRRVPPAQQEIEIGVEPDTPRARSR